MDTLSLCLIVRDEADVLERCLESAAGLYDELVVVDTGSTDATRAIARRCGVSEGKVRVTLHRTRQKLRVYLEERGVRV